MISLSPPTICNSARSHNAIHPLCINHRQAVPLRLPSQQRPHTAITIRRQVSHRHVYPGQYGGIVRTGLPSAILSVRWPVNLNAQLRTRHAKTSANVAYSSFGQRGRMRNPFFARPNSTASLSISASIVFLPRRRWSSRICLLAAASSEAGTTSSPDATAVSEPS